MKKENSSKSWRYKRVGLFLIVMITISMGGFFIGKIKIVNAITEDYYEDFSTTTYKDAEKTNAIGWGSRAVTCPNKELSLAGIYSDNINRADDIFIDGNFAYIADGKEGLKVLNISDPLNPVYVGKSDVSFETTKVKVEGNLAFVLESLKGLGIYDITSPENPTRIGSINSMYITDFAIEGNIAYITQSMYGLAVIDISDPTSPSVVGQYIAPEYSSALTVSGDNLFLVGWEGLQILDISDCMNPQALGMYNLIEIATDIEIDGDVAYIVDYTANLFAINITDPLSPTRLDAIDTMPAHGISAYDIKLLGNFAFVANGIGLCVININYPSNLVIKTTFEASGAALSVALFGDLAFVANYYAGISIVKIGDYTNIERKWQFETYSMRVYDIAISGDYAFVLDDYYLLIYDITNPLNPIKIGQRFCQRDLYSIEISGNYAFIAGDQVFFSMDISNPSNPRIVRVVGGYAFDVAIAGNFAFVAGLSYGLRVFDITNPGAFREIARLSGLNCNFVNVEGDFAYVGCRYDGLRIIDISNPRKPIELSRYDTIGFVRSITISGNLAYIADSTGLIVLDISDPSTPLSYSYLETDSILCDVAISGDMAYLANSYNGTKLVDISNPKNPVEIANCDSEGSSYKIKIVGDYAFVADLSGGFYILEIMINYGRQYEYPTIAQSTAIFSSMNSNIVESARLYYSISSVPLTSLAYYLSADGGVNWERVSYGQTIKFDHIGNELKWKVVFTSSYPIRRPILREIRIIYNIVESEPSIDHPSDITYEHGSTGNYITWNPWSISPESFTVIRDAVIAVDYGRWDGGPIIVNVDGLSLGEHLFVCSVYDTEGHCTTDTLFVMVIDTAAPIIDSPADIEYEEFTTGHVITWNPSDNNPATYNVTRDGELVKEGAWFGASINVNADGLTPGDYIFECSVYDASGNSVSDTMQVTVTEAYIPPQPHEPILVEKDDDFVVKYNFPGSGTEEDPFRISNYIIQGYPYDVSIYIKHTTKHFIVENCYIQYCAEGIHLFNISENTATIINNTIINAQFDSIYLQDSSKATIAENRIYNGQIGIIAMGVNNEIKIINNLVIDQERYGIFLSNGPNGIITGNYIENSGNIGFYVTSSIGATIANNTCINDGFRIEAQYEEYSTLTIENNIVNGKAFGFFLEKDNLIIDENLYGQILLVYCNNIEIRNQILQQTDYAIIIKQCNEITLENNYITNNMFGLKLEYVDQIDIINNTFSEHSFECISSSATDNVFISNNTLNNNRYGIWLGAYSFLVTNNLFSNNELLALTVSGNYQPGSRIVHHNTFIDNNLEGTSQARDYNGLATWYDTEKLEGNYWSDWSGTGPYYLEGDVEIYDPYPLSEPVTGGNNIENEPFATKQNRLPLILTIIAFASFCIIARIGIIRKRKK